MISEKDILELLDSVVHPEFDKSIVQLQMVEALVVGEDKISFTLKTQKIRDPFVSSIKKVCELKIADIHPQYSGKVLIIVREPSKKDKPAKPVSKQITTENSPIKNIIVVSSAKGGVGKSTVTSNLAVMLAKSGKKVGLIDADIYGPSQPKMFGLEGYLPSAESIDGVDTIIPAEKYGVKLMSIGFFIKPDDALVWRGPMATSALKQMIHQTKWGELDYLLIDLPPGTGDVHLTLIAELKVTGAIIVSTPQNVALADVLRGISMFKSENVNIPIVGIVENMAWFTPKELPENKYYIFGKDGAKKLAEEQNIALIGQIPISESICEAGDSGVPESLNNEIIEKEYQKLISHL
ncbi:MAG: Mrp/NBP35 family ATP-binding protein [Rikenellaceae bacterium]